MNKLLITGTVLIVAIAGIVMWNKSYSERVGQIKRLVPDAKATIVASPTCGCCRLYSQYLQQQGFDVDFKAQPQEDVDRYKDTSGIPPNLRSCHTTRIGDYLIEGHIPVEAITKLFKEKPAIKGIAMPGMPSASPGMPGPKYGPFIIRTITNNNQDGGIFLQL